MQGIYHLFVEHFGFTGALAMVLAGFVAVTLVLLPVAAICGLATWVERKIAADCQRRIGPNTAGPIGILQFLADGIKLLIKEDIVPAKADAPLFRLAPYLGVVGAFAAFAVVPFSENVWVANLNIGVFYILSVTSISVISILMAGWAQNNKWGILGGFRSAAQVVSYEIPVGLCILAVVLYTGQTNMLAITQAQQTASPLSFLSWTLCQSPLLFVPLAGIYFLAALAECNRTPFDLPEAESELVAGFHTEYSGMRWSMFFIAEYGDMLAVSCIFTTLFMGGYTLPLFDHQVVAWFDQFRHGFVAVNAVHLLCFVVKVLLAVFVQMWMRWTLPRFRVDQMMDLCWKKLIPISFVLILLTMLVTLP